MLKILSFIIFVSLASTAYVSADKNYKEGFVSINKIDSSIIINLKYVHKNNILNKNVLGYNSSDALLTMEAAKALLSVQEYLVARGFSLVIYDAYHPLKTYKMFENWCSMPDQDDVKKIYHPNVSKRELSRNGYIKNKLDHTRGSTVDVTIIPLNQRINDSHNIKKLNYKNVGDIMYADDGTVNMGSSYDLFDPISSHECDLIEQSAKDNRALLKKAMESNGFIANDKVWWQYKLAREPFVDSNFDFDV